MTGYDVLTVETMKPGLLCPECGLVLRDAVQTNEGTRLCLTCFKELAKSPARISQKTGFVLQNDKYNPDRAVRKEINQVLVYCRFKNHGCPWEGCLQYFESHILDCKYHPVKCPNHGCSQLLPKEQMDKHIDTECMFRQICCDDCGHTMPAAKLPEHRNTCPEYTIDCSECGTPVKRKDLSAHLLNSCPAPTCTVPGCEKKKDVDEYKIALWIPEMEPTENVAQLRPIITLYGAKLPQNTILICINPKQATGAGGIGAKPPDSCTVQETDTLDLVEVTDYLLTLEKPHIYNLGLVLGLCQHKVKALKESETFLDDVIAAWLRKEDGVAAKGEPSWKTLVKALRHDRVGQNGIAGEIQRDKGI